VPRLRERDLTQARPPHATFEPRLGQHGRNGDRPFRESDATLASPRSARVALGTAQRSAEIWGLVLARHENEGRDARAIEELLRELSELRELDQKRHAQAPGSAAHDAATLAVDLKSRRLFDRFRDLKLRRLRRSKATDLDDTRRVDARRLVRRLGGSPLN
jgi:hypothetical protein